MNEPILEVKNLKKHFISRKSVMGEKSRVRAVDGVTFDVFSGETLGLVGESGCGKSTTGRLILKLLEPTEGEIYFDGREISRLNEREMRERRRQMQMIFQDPYASLNPRMTVGEIIAEPLVIHKLYKRQAKEERVRELMELVGLNEESAKRYPHEFSGGQRQRIGIARALSVNPKLIIADEPVAALDVSIQSQIINLMQDLQEQFGLTYLFISHDLSVVEHICDRIIVMYLGNLVEISDKKSLFKKPLHPYTQALLSAILTTELDTKRERIILEGDIPNPSNPPKGCVFHPRCRDCMDICKTEVPELKEVQPGRWTACHLY